MHATFLIVNTLLGTAGSYLVFKQFRNLGLLAAGACLVISSAVSFAQEQWWTMILGMGAAYLLHRLIGDPLEA